MTNREIIEAAFKVWGREYYLNVSLSQLAQELGVSKPALYRHFKNKGALLDAITGYYFDDIAAFIQAELANSPAGGTGEQNAFRLIRAVAAYYGRNVYMFLFALVRVHDRDNITIVEKEMRYRGLEINMNGGSSRSLTLRMIFTTITFFMADFHKQRKSFTNPPTEAAISARIETISEIIERGLGYSIQDINTLAYEKLELCIAGAVANIKDDPLFKAVAQAIAEAGPWKASMEQVARYSGLSKSSLYGHFKNKEDMLRRFFVNEFMRIIEFTRQGMDHSRLPTERLYLSVFSIAMYLRAKPEILNTLNRFRTRKLEARRREGLRLSQKNCDKEDGGLPPEFLNLFCDLKLKPLRSGERFDGEENRRRMPHWILFLLVSILMRQDATSAVQHKDIRTMYRYVTLGIKGLKVYEKEKD